MRYKKKVLLTLNIFILTFLLLSNIPFSNGIITYEDFTTYTSQDTNNHINVINSTLVNANLSRNEDAYLYYNYGSEFFENFTHYVDIYGGDDINNDAVIYIWLVANKTDDGLGIESSGDTGIGVYFYDMYSIGGLKRIVLRESYGGNPYTDAYTGLNVATWYYLTIIKDGINMTVFIYSDVIRTTIVDTLSLTLQANHKLPYIFACNSYNSGNALQSKTYIRNLWIGFEAYMITFYYNSGGILRVNNATVINGTQLTYNNGTVLEIASLTQNASYVWLNFTWLTYNSTINPYNFTVISNSTLWCYFFTVSALIDLTLPITILISLGVICILLIIAKIKR